MRWVGDSVEVEVLACLGKGIENNRVVYMVVCVVHVCVIHSNMIFTRVYTSMCVC